MHHGHLSRLLLTALAMAACLTVWPRTKGTDDADARKADYFYLGQTTAAATDQDARALLLARRAHQLNPGDLSVANAYGKLLFKLPDPLYEELGFAMMLSYYQAGLGKDEMENTGLFLLNASRLGYIPETRELLEEYFNQYPYDERVAGIYNLIRTREAETPETFRELLAVCDTVEARQPDNLNVIGWRQGIYEVLGDTAGLFALGRNMALSDTVSAQKQLMAARILKDVASPEELLGYYNRAIAIDPQSGYLRYARAVHYLQQQEDTLAYRNEIRNALLMPDVAVDEKLELLPAYLEVAEITEVPDDTIRTVLDAVVTLHPHEPGPHYIYGQYLYSLNDAAGAAEQLGYSLDMEPDNRQLWLQVAQLQYAADDLKDAYATASRGLELFAGDIPLTMLMSHLESDNGETDKAVNRLNELAATLSDRKDAKDLSRIHTSIADMLYKAGLQDSAFVHYDTALYYNPANSLAMNNCAYFLACSGRDLDRALDLAIKAAQADPESATNLDTYAWVLFKRKDYAKAREIIDVTMAMTLDREASAEILEHAGDIYFMDGEPVKALEFWTKALELDPDNELLKRKVTHKTYFYE